MNTCISDHVTVTLFTPPSPANFTALRVSYIEPELLLDLGVLPSQVVNANPSDSQV